METMWLTESKLGADTFLNFDVKRAAAGGVDTGAKSLAPGYKLTLKTPPDKPKLVIFIYPKPKRGRCVVITFYQDKAVLKPYDTEESLRAYLSSFVQLSFFDNLKGA